MCEFLGLQAMTEPCISRTSKLDLYRLVSFPKNQAEFVILLFVTLFITLIYTSGHLWPYGGSTLLNLHKFLFRLLVLYFPLPHSVSSNRNLTLLHTLLHILAIQQYIWILYYSLFTNSVRIPVYEGIKHKTRSCIVLDSLNTRKQPCLHWIGPVWNSCLPFK